MKKIVTVILLFVVGLPLAAITFQLLKADSAPTSLSDIEKSPKEEAPEPLKGEPTKQEPVESYMGLDAIKLDNPKIGTKINVHFLGCKLSGDSRDGLVGLRCDFKKYSGLNYFTLFVPRVDAKAFVESRGYQSIDCNLTKIENDGIVCAVNLDNANTGSSLAVECSNLEFKDVELNVWLFNSQAAKEDRSLEHADLAEKKREEICAQARCLMDRDKIDFSALSSKLISAGPTPFMKQSRAEAIERMNLKECLNKN